MSCPFDYVDVLLLRATDGTCTRDLRLDGPALHLLSYGGSVRALGLEPSLFRGKGPVPHQSGVTREWVGRDSSPRCEIDGGSTV